MVVAVVISLIVFLAVDLTCRRLDIMSLEVEIALKLWGRRRRQTRWKTRWQAPSDHDKAMSPQRALIESGQGLNVAVLSYGERFRAVSNLLV